MVARFFQIATMAAGLLAGSAGLFAQVSGTPPFQLQIQPGVPGGVEVEPAATAVFEPAEAVVGRPVIYKVTITGSARALEVPDPLPAPPGLEISPGGRSISTGVIGGALMVTTTLRFSAVASRAGKLTMPEFEVPVGTKRVRVPAAVVMVANPAPGEDVYKPARVELDLPKREFFVGETIPARLLVIETADESPQYVAHVAKTNGSAVFRPSMRTKREQFTRGGEQLSGLAMPVQITPILDGEMELSCQILVHVQKLDPTGRRSGFTVQVTLDSAPLKIRVLALPRAGRLPGFNGGIGTFTIAQPRLAASEVEVGEPVTLSLMMTGLGNLEGVAGPEVEAGGGWTAYKPTSEYQPDQNDPYTSRGTKSFIYTLVSNRVGQKSTPPIPFSYFDPEKRAYVDITVPPLPITVKPSSAAPAPASPTATPEAPAPEPPRAAELAMTGLEEKPGRWVRSLGPSLDARWFPAIQAVPPVLLLALWAWRRRKEYLAANPHILRQRRARTAVRRALAAARSAARKGDRSEFLRAGVGALREAAAPLDTAQAASLTREEVLRLLRGDEAASALARKVLESAEAANFSTKTAGEFEPSAMLPGLERAVRTLASRA